MLRACQNKDTCLMLHDKRSNGETMFNVRCLNVKFHLYFKHPLILTDPEIKLLQKKKCVVLVYLFYHSQLYHFESFPFYSPPSIPSSLPTPPYKISLSSPPNNYTHLAPPTPSLSEGRGVIPPLKKKVLRVASLLQSIIP